MTVAWQGIVGRDAGQVGRVAKQVGLDHGRARGGQAVLGLEPPVIERSHACNGRGGVAGTGRSGEDRLAGRAILVADAGTIIAGSGTGGPLDVSAGGDDLGLDPPARGRSAA